MGTTAHNHSNKLGLRVRAALVGVSAIYVAALVLLTGALPLPSGLATAQTVPAPATRIAIHGSDGQAQGWADTADFLPALQINGIGITPRPDF